MSGWIASILERKTSIRSVSLLTGIISLPSWIPSFISPVLSRITIAHSSACLSHQAIDVIGIGACAIYSGVNAPPISISMSKNTSLWVLEISSLVPYLLIRNFEPRARLVQISTMPVIDRNAYAATISFYVQNSPDRITVESFLERLR